MKIASRSTMVEEFGEANVVTLENGRYDFSQHVDGFYIKFETRLEIVTKNDRVACLVAFKLQDKEVFASLGLDELDWDEPNYYAYEIH